MKLFAEVGLSDCHLLQFVGFPVKFFFFFLFLKLMGIVVGLIMKCSSLDISVSWESTGVLLIRLFNT